MNEKYKVLIVDDDVMIVKLLYEILHDKYEIETAYSGEEAITILNNFLPDVVILDVMMPGMNGYEVCKYIRSNQRLCRSKVVFLTAKLINDDKMNGYKAGGDDYLIKPFENSELLAKVKVFSRLKYEEDKHPRDLISDKNTLKILYEISECILDIAYIKSESPYCKIKLANRKKEYKLRATIKVIEDYFHGKGLIRVHRSFLINPNKVISIIQQDYRDYKLKLKCQNKIAEVPVGRTYYSKIKSYFTEQSKISFTKMHTHYK